MRNKLKYIVTALLLLLSCSYAAMSTGDIGTNAGQFLKLGAGARASGMGEAYTAISEDASSIYFNPAGLNSGGSFGLILMHAIWFEGVSYEWGGLNFSLGSMGKLGLGVQYVSYGSLIESDSTGLDTGSFAPSDLSASLSYANNVGGFDLGITAKYISLTIKQSATAFAFDAGLIYKMINQTNTKLNIGVMAANLGTGINFGSLKEQLASSYKLGVGFMPVKNFLLSVDVCLPSDNALFIAGGAEYTVNTGNDLDLKVRAGYNTRNLDTGGMSGFTAGLGLGNREYGVDYAFVPFGILGYTHRVSFSVAFGKTNFVPGRKFEIAKDKIVKESPKEKKVEALKEVEPVKEPQPEVTAEKLPEISQIKETKPAEEIKKIKQEVPVQKSAPKKKKRIIRKMTMSDGSTTFMTIYPEATPEQTSPVQTEKIQPVSEAVIPPKNETQEEKTKRIREEIRKSLNKEK